MRKMTVCIAMAALFVVAMTSSATRNEEMRQRIEASHDIAWLEEITDIQAAEADLHPQGGLGNSAKDAAFDAYARLGSLGTQESLAAVRRIEAKAREIVPCPERWTLEKTVRHPCWHFADGELKPVQQQAQDGTEVCVFPEQWLGDWDLFLSTTKTPQDASSWSRPKLIARQTHSFENPELIQLPADPLQLKLRYTESLFISVGHTIKDSDGDGWTDIEEQRLGLNPRSADTDGDGIPDGKDGCPDYKPDPKDAEQDEPQIIQKAFFAAFGLTQARHVLLVDGKSKRVQLWGYAGPVLYEWEKTELKNRIGKGAIRLSWEIRKISAAEAEVGFFDYEGNVAAGSQTLYLKKVGKEWFVVKRKFGGVS